MRILVLAHTPPWPATSGARLRLSNIIRGLGRLGDIDLFVMTNGDPELPLMPANIPIRRVRAVARGREAFTIGRRLGWLIGGSLPSDFAGRDYGSIRRSFSEWRGDYDLIWCSRVETYLALKPLINARTVVDIDDLEDWKVSTRLNGVYPLRIRNLLNPRRVLTTTVAWIQGVKNILAWRRLQGEVSASVDAVVVCSELDARRLGVGNRFVVPNGYDFQPDPVGRPTVGQPPTIVLPGYFKYPPNVDAAWYFVQSILPLLAARIPAVRVRLVGDADDRVMRLGSVPRIDVTGFVEDMRTELGTADLVVVPLRFGSGTRIKILEAFAHRIPVVSTSLGAEGINAVHGREILLADTPQSFADACVRLLSDEPTRAVMIQSAYELFLTKYRWEDIHGLVESVGVRVAGDTEPDKPQPEHAPALRVGSHVGRH